MSTTEHREAMIEHLSSQITAELAKPAERPVPEPGLHNGLPYDIYERWDAINHSVLKLFARSAAHAREEMLHPKEPTTFMEFGQATHLAILEPERFESEVIVAPDRGRRSNADKDFWAEFEREHRGNTILKRDEFDTLRAMKDAVWAHPACRKFISAPGLNEASFAWADPRTGVLCKAREDMLREVDGWPWLLNLKSAKDASRGAFSRQMFYLQYHEAAAFYIDGMKALDPDSEPRFAFLAVEKERPFGCAVWELEDASIAQGRSQYREHLSAYKACLETGDWPGYSREADYVSIPAWALKGFNDGD